MANRHRGEIEAVLDGAPHLLCLTLGSLAELEAELGASDLPGLLKLLSRGSLASREIAAVIAAGLRGCGGNQTAADVARMHCEGGAAAMAQIAAALLNATFGPPR
jgi:hypothetical protein